MKRFQILTDYIPVFSGDVFPLEQVDRFMADVYRAVEANPELGLADCWAVLAEAGIDDPKDTDVSELDARCVCALILANVEAERFCEDAVFNSCVDGTMVEWLRRLKTLDR